MLCGRHRTWRHHGCGGFEEAVDAVQAAARAFCTMAQWPRTHLEVNQALKPIDASDVVVVEEEGAQGGEPTQLEGCDVGDLVAAQMQHLQSLEACRNRG